MARVKGKRYNNVDLSEVYSRLNEDGVEYDPQAVHFGVEFANELADELNGLEDISKHYMYERLLNKAIFKDADAPYEIAVNYSWVSDIGKIRSGDVIILDEEVVASIFENYDPGTIALGDDSKFLVNRGKGGHPILILKNNKDGSYYAALISSGPARYRTDVDIKDWKLAGLRRESHIELNIRKRVFIKDLAAVIGVLTKGDFEEVKRSHYRVANYNI